MRFLLIALLFTAFSCNSQSMVKLGSFAGQDVKVSDFDLHYLAGATASGWASSTYYYFYPNRRVRASLVGVLFGTTVGLLKEEVWDRNWQMGHPTLNDKIATTAGSCFIVLHFQIGIDLNYARIDRKRRKRGL